MMRRRLFQDHHEQFRSRFRAFVDREVRPHRDTWAATGVVSREAWLAAGREGFLCTAMAKDYGGGGLDFLHSVVICEELARAHEFGFGVNLHSDIVVPYVERLGTDDQKARYLPLCASGECVTAIAITEPGGGSDLAAIETQAVYVADDDEYVLDGRKVFVSNGALCDLVIVVARTAERTADVAGLSLFLVDARSEGFSRGAAIRKIGFASQDTVDLVLDGCRVPASALLGQPGAAGPSILQRLQQERLIVAVAAQARAEQVLEETIAFAQRHTIGGRHLAAFQNTAFRLAECAAKVEVGRAHIDALCAAHAAGDYLQRECAIAKLWHTEMLSEVADACVQLWGSRACLAEHAVGRAYVDARIQRIYAGTNEVMKLIIASELGLGRAS